MDRHGKGLRPDGQSQERTGIDGRYERLLEPRVLETLRRAFNQMNRAMVPLWQLGLGRLMSAWPAGTGRLLVLEHVGRRSGRRYLTPVNYTRDGDDLFVLAAFGEKTHWYRNLLAAPQAAVWLPEGRWLAQTEDVDDDPRRLEHVRQVLIDAGFVAPLLGLHPARMSDESLARATSTYRLLRIRPRRPEAAPDGPGSLAWVWAVPTLSALLLMVGRLRRRRAARMAV